MNEAVSKLARCAVYTRKSTEYNLELAFNSLDAQREACEAYIKSQAHEGWRAIPGRYDDGAFSGASLDRPALQQLLAEVRASKIDIVLVYKVDRLTRSLADFAKLIELFDAHGVSFVSVTQSFNTSSSMGRLTLNVLLSFAQFERELIGERVRDKIAASKRKGIWVGGPVPLGYAAMDKKIVVVPAEAEVVRMIFAQYLQLGSIRAVAEELDRQGIRSKPRRLSNGRTVGGGRFGVGALAYLFKNRFYIGEVVYRGEVHRGEHEPILNSALFEAVQAKLAAQAVTRRCRLRGSPAILSGRLFDNRGNRMSPTHANKGGARYRYYVSQAVLQRKPPPAGSISRVAAAEIEALVITALRNQLRASGAGEQLPDNDLELLERHLERVTLTPNHLELRLRQSLADRTQVQHAWATSVEVVSRISENQPKFEKGDERYIEFFRLASEIIARVHEQTYSCYKDVSRADLIARFEVLDADINLVRMLHSLHTIYEGADGGNLILQFSQRGHLLIHQVADQEATEAYFRLEKDNPGDDIVLVSADTFDEIRSAYRNYFSDPRDFLKYLHEASQVLAEKDV